MSDADDMLAKARSDLDMVRRAMTPPTDQNLEQAAYHLQQAAEKAVKALLIHLGIAYPRGGAKGHDIKLSALLIPSGHRLHSDANALVSLTPWATAFRYLADDPLTAPKIPTAKEIESWESKVKSFAVDVDAEILKAQATP
jgi:hypothetical protein